MKTTYFLFLGLVLTLSACGPTLSPFTQSLYEDSRFSANELKQIQFYLSDDLILERQVSGNLSEVIEGEIRMVDGRKVEQITFRAGTPGVFVFSPKENRLAISFEDGDDRFLVFGPNPRVGNRYVLLASDWQNRYGFVSYAGKQWRVGAQDAYTTLMVDLERMSRTEVNNRVAGGRRIE